MEQFIKGYNGEKIFLKIWDNVENPKAIVQISHGMVEHINRYDHFAKFLNKSNIVVYGDDQRGHGNSILKNEDLGYIGEDGFYNIVEDKRIITDIIREKYDKLPIFIFSHSFGSFIGQEYILKYSDKIDGIIFSGSAKQNGINIKAGAIFAKIQNTIMDSRKKANFLDKISFGSYNKKIKNPRTKFDWLSRDEKEIDKYVNDKYCGYIASINFYYEFLNNLGKLYDNRVNNIRKDLPIFIISGDMDPVGAYGKAVEALYEHYSNLNDIEMKLLEGARHEIINEINKEEVYEIILNWIKKRIIN